MGHITVDRLDDAWNHLNKAKYQMREDQTHSSVLYCEKALDECYKSADGMGFGVWFSGKEDTIRRDIGELKAETEPDAEDVRELIEECRDLIKDCARKCVPELHSRIDYEPIPSRFEY